MVRAMLRFLCCNSWPSLRARCCCSLLSLRARSNSICTSLLSLLISAMLRLSLPSVVSELKRGSSVSAELGNGEAGSDPGGAGSDPGGAGCVLGVGGPGAAE